MFQEHRSCLPASVIVKVSTYHKPIIM